MEARLSRWFPVLFFWLFQVGLTSTATGYTRHESLERSAIAWGVWALLTPLIVSIDRRLPVSKEAIFKRFLMHIPFSLLFTAINLYVDAVVGKFILTSSARGLPSAATVLKQSLSGPFQARIVVYWVVLFAYITLDYASHLRERKIRTAELERLVLEARLESLRAKLNPHFLFNTLNTISAHVEREPRIARRLLEELGELLRLSLAHADEEEVPLSEEIEFIERYLSLQKARLDERLRTLIEVDPEVLDALVPPLILQPLVENAIRHGVGSRVEPTLIEVRAWPDGERLQMSISDDGPGLRSDSKSESRAGIGISSTRERLRWLYGESGQSFTITSVAASGVRAEISIPLRRSNIYELTYEQHSGAGRR